MTGNEFLATIKITPDVFELLGFDGIRSGANFVSRLEEIRSISVRKWDELNLNAKDMVGEQIIEGQRRVGLVEYVIFNHKENGPKFSWHMNIGDEDTLGKVLEEIKSRGVFTVDAVVQTFTETIVAESIQHLANGVAGKQPILPVNKYYNIYFMP
ncbi:MAG: hypothetical protein K0S38_985 [Candidatus Paceibacter sp.]|jgi:hypothetical protein|nr:hypothetical protein [Candidatus Paceibacter sp.]